MLICPTLSSICSLPNFVALHFFKWMPYVEQFPLSAGCPQFICTCRLQIEHRMGSRKFPVSILVSCYVLCKQTSSIRVLFKSRHFIFAKFKHFHYTIAHLYSLADLIHYPCINNTPLLFRVCTFALIRFVGTRRTQQEHQFGIAFVRKNRIIHFRTRQNLIFNNNLPIQTVRAQSAPVYTFGWPKGKLPYLQKKGYRFITSK